MIYFQLDLNFAGLILIDRMDVILLVYFGFCIVYLKSSFPLFCPNNLARGSTCRPFSAYARILKIAPVSRDVNVYEPRTRALPSSRVFVLTGSALTVFWKVAMCYAVSSM